MLRELAETAMEKHRGRFAPPALAITGEWDNWQYGCPYHPDDQNLWQALLFEVFGTRSISAATVFLDQLARLVGKRWVPDEGDWRPEPKELNQAIVIIASLKVDNEAQACLAAQFVATHLAAMKLGDVMGRQCYPDERTVATLARASKASAALAETLAGLQGKRCNRQEIHVSYYDQRDQRQQTVNAGGGPEIGGQPRAKEIDIAPDASRVGRPALPSPRQDDGASVPVASGEGQAGLPDAWWLARLWRTFRRGQRVIPARGLDA